MFRLDHQNHLRSRLLSVLRYLEADCSAIVNMCCILCSVQRIETLTPPDLHQKMSSMISTALFIVLLGHLLFCVILWRQTYNSPIGTSMP